MDDNTDNKALFFKLFSAKTEEELNQIIVSDSVLSNDENWEPLGNTRSNLGATDNQQSKSIAALVEKPINSIDALLTKECWHRGIDPESDAAPKTMQEAVEQFFDIPNGDFSEINEAKRREIAKKIQIIAEGDKKKPCLIIYDSGEGQHPLDFKNTFLSLHKENKIKIKFVQGKYNMGGTGVLRFCGKNGYQLILSRKDKELLRGREDLYGFTLVRYHRASGKEYKQSWFEYSVAHDKKIITFKDKELDLGLYEKKFDAGTLIKLYDYDLPGPSMITIDLWRYLNRYLYHPALPILLYEKREYAGHGPTKLMLGNKMRIAIDEREQFDEHFSLNIMSDGNSFPAEVTLFKPTVKKTEFIDKLAVVFTVNGQVHAHYHNSFIANDAKLPYLKDHLLVNIDCSNINTDIQEDIFMASRDRRRDNEFSRKLDNEIARELRDNETLKVANEKRREEKMQNAVAEEDFLNKIMNKLLSRNKEIGKILRSNGKVISSEKKEVSRRTEKEGEKFKPKRFPTYVRFKNIKPGSVKMIPQNGECLLTLETDVEDEYLLRPKEKGELRINFEKSFIPAHHEGTRTTSGADEETFNCNRVGPNKGEIKLRLKDKNQLPVGSEIKVNLELTSPDGPCIASTVIKIDNPHEKSEEKKIQTRETYSLPKRIYVYEKPQKSDSPKWKDYSWTEDNICEIIPSSDAGVDAIAINMDAFALRNYIRSNKITTEKGIEKTNRTFELGVVFISLLLYFQIHQAQESLSFQGEDMESREEFVAFLMKGVGNIIMDLTLNNELLSDLENEDEAASKEVSEYADYSNNERASGYPLKNPTSVGN